MPLAYTAAITRVRYIDLPFFNFPPIVITYAYICYVTPAPPFFPERGISSKTTPIDCYDFKILLKLLYKTN